MQVSFSNSGNDLIGIWLASVANVFATNHLRELQQFALGFATTWDVESVLAVASTHLTRAIPKQFVEGNAKANGFAALATRMRTTSLGRARSKVCLTGIFVLTSASTCLK